MRYFKNLYVSDGIKEREQEIIERLEKKKFQFRIYLLALPENEKNQLEIYHSGMLLQNWYREKDVFVVGIAGGYLEALELVRKIAEETVELTGDANIRQYILEQQGK
nr:hypothetical protein [uncultured Sellimonas sp.]